MSKCVAEHMGGKRCVVRCMDPRDCVGDPLPADVGVGSYSVAEVDRIVKQTIAFTIERCAQVVDALIKKANRGEIAKLEEAAAEIRKLQG